jgi:hypothetical protein
VDKPPAYLDASCLHASLASVLAWHGDPDPRLVLGAGAATSAVADGGELQFHDIYDELAAMCALRGYRCSLRAASSSEAWEQTASWLERSHPVIALVDPFHLPYYWIDYHRTHSRHAIVLWAYSRESDELLISDSTEIMNYSGVVSRAAISASWTAEARGQQWLDLDGEAPAHPDRATLAAEIGRHLDSLAVDSDTLACISLARYVIEHLSELLDLAQRVGAPNPRLGVDARRRRNSHILRGIWNYHHTLRWFGMFVEAADISELRVTRAASVRQMAQHWLLVRNLLLKHGLSDGSRRAPIAAECVRRLVTVIELAQTLCGSPPIASHAC